MARSASAEGAVPPEDASGPAETVMAPGGQFVGELLRTKGRVSGKAVNVVRTHDVQEKGLVTAAAQMSKPERVSGNKELAIQRNTGPIVRRPGQTSSKAHPFTAEGRSQEKLETPDIPEKGLFIAGTRVSEPEHVAGRKELAAQQNAGSIAPRRRQTPSKVRPFATERRSQEKLETPDPENRKSATEALYASGRSAGVHRLGSRQIGPGTGEGAHVRRTVNTGITRAGENETSLSDSNKGPNAQAESVASMADEPVPAPQRLSTQMPVPVGAESAAARSRAQTVSEQILDSMQASLARGDRQISVRLHPPELGSVLMRLRDDGEQIHGVLEVSKSDTRYEIEQALPQVLRSLQDSGIQVRRFEVVVADQPERDLGKGQLPQDAWPQQQDSGQYTGHQQHSSGTGWSADGRAHQGGIEYAERSQSPVSTAPDHIDMLI